MIRVLYTMLLSFISSTAFAIGAACSTIAARVESPNDNFRPPLEALVAGKEKLFFYSAPDLRCKIKPPVAASGTFLTVYKRHKRWLQVMYIAKDGNDTVAWVPSSRLKIVGRYGSKP